MLVKEPMIEKRNQNIVLVLTFFLVLLDRILEHGFTKTLNDGYIFYCLNQYKRYHQLIWKNLISKYGLCSKT
jgi:hypothetical protein